MQNVRYSMVEYEWEIKAIPGTDTYEVIVEGKREGYGVSLKEASVLIQNYFYCKRHSFFDFAEVVEK